WIAPELRAILPADPQAAYETWLAWAAEDNFHEKQGRSTGRYIIRDLPSAPAVYIKKYFRLPWWLRWLAPLQHFPGPAEMQRIEQVRRLGILVPQVIAAGADRRNACPSFLAVRELEGFVELHKHVTWRYGRENTAASAAQKRALARRIAEIARRLHDA